MAYCPNQYAKAHLFIVGQRGFLVMCLSLSLGDIMENKNRDHLYAKSITILPGSKVEFEDFESGERHTVTISESITVQAVRKQTISVLEDDYGKEETEGR